MTGRVVEVVDVTPRHAEQDNLLLDSSLPGVPDVQVARIRAASDSHQATFAIVFAAFASEPQRRAAEPKAAATRTSTPASMLLAGFTCLVLTVGAVYVVLFTHLWTLLKIPVAGHDTLARAVR